MKGNACCEKSDDLKWASWIHLDWLVQEGSSWKRGSSEINQLLTHKQNNISNKVHTSLGQIVIRSHAGMESMQRSYLCVAWAWICSSRILTWPPSLQYLNDSQSLMNLLFSQHPCGTGKWYDPHHSDGELKLTQEGHSGEGDEPGSPNS